MCDPIDGTPPGSPVPEILQARTLEWGAIAFRVVEGTTALVLLQRLLQPGLLAAVQLDVLAQGVELRDDRPADLVPIIQSAVEGAAGAAERQEIV